MAVKKKNKKKKDMEALIKKSIRIKCSHCAFEDNCRNRLKELKLKSEEMGINTYCSFAKKRNRPIKKK